MIEKTRQSLRDRLDLITTQDFDREAWVIRINETSDLGDMMFLMCQLDLMKVLQPRDK